MPKTEYLGLYVMETANEKLSEFVDSMIMGEGTEVSPFSDPQKIDKAIKDLNENKQKKLTAGFGISIDENGNIALSLENASEGAY